MPTFSGLNPPFELAAFPLKERQAIMRFARHFYITRAAQSVQVGNSSYRAFLMRPAEDDSAILSVEREIAVALLKPRPDGALKIWPVGKMVGNVNNKGPSWRCRSSCLPILGV